ncbi:septation regulator SpoVG [bacterium]|nr:septation regulator SpoVG [bacterium]
MELTDIRISIRDEEKLKAFVTITFDECFVVRGVKIIHGNRGLFVAMPSRRRPDGTFQDIAHPIQSEMRDRLEEEILAAYQAALEAPVPSSSLQH